MTLKTLSACAVLLVATACASTPVVEAVPSEPAAHPAWTYEVAVAPGLKRLRVRMAFANAPPGRLQFGVNGALRGVGPVVVESSGRRLERSAGRWTVGELEPGAWLAYELDLDACLYTGDGAARGYRSGDDVVTPPGLWLLCPVTVSPDAAARLHVTLPDGVHMSAPWGRRMDLERTGAERVFDLPPSTFGWLARVAFTRQEPLRVPAAGAMFDVAVLDGGLRVSKRDVRRWIETAAECAAEPHRGRFPVDRVQVLVHPFAWAGAPVAFGETHRGGGPAVSLLVARNARPGELVGEWVAVHEFLHLGMPWIADGDRWLSEGLATYYQNVVRARRGVLTPEMAWEKHRDGLRRGREDGGELTLAEASRTMRRRHAYTRVYWGGAAVALLWDVELRQTTAGRLGLDDAIRELWRLHGGSGRSHAAADLVRDLDRWLGRPLFSAVADRELVRPRFPDLGRLERDLGLISGSEEPSSGPPPLGEIRKAIMASSLP